MWMWNKNTRRGNARRWRAPYGRTHSKRETKYEHMHHNRVTMIDLDAVPVLPQCVCGRVLGHVRMRRYVSSICHRHQKDMERGNGKRRTGCVASGSVDSAASDSRPTTLYGVHLINTDPLKRTRNPQYLLVEYRSF
jgi:hypothetical protein